MALNESQLFSQLGDALLQEVLQRVPQRQRLGQCALVCSAWREAANLVTTEVVCTLKRASGLAALKQWLHAGQLRGLELTWEPFWEEVIVDLPWAKLSALQRLDLQACRLPRITHAGISSMGGTPDAAPPPQLKQLKLDQCFFDSLRDFCLWVAGSTALTSLHVEVVRIGGVIFQGPHDFTGSEEIDTGMCKYLPQLQQLRALSLPGLNLGAKAFQPIAALTHLQHLELRLTDNPDSLADLPPSITHLQLRRWGNRPPLPPPKLQTFTNLQVLRLDGQCSLSPKGLASCTRLLRLHLSDCTLLPDAAKGSSDLLRALQQLTCLESLDLTYGSLDINISDDTDPLQLYSGLTASTRLTKLWLQAYGAQPLPEGGAVRHMFPAGRQMPHLQSLKLCTDNWHDGWPGPGFQQTGWCVDSEGLSGICACAPGLTALELLGVVQPGGADATPLLQLSSCSSLVIGGQAFKDAAAEVVAQLPQLTCLRISECRSLTDLGLERLTSLSALVELSVYDCGLSEELCRDLVENPGRPVFTLRNERGPVWQQLKSMCDKSPDCWRRRLQRQEAEATRMREQAQTLQQQLADRDAQLAASQAQAEKLQQRLSQFEGGGGNDQP